MTVHIVGAGIAGLSAAIRLQQAGSAACLWEAALHAGGRVRSFPDAKFGRCLDNGAHLLLSGNRRLLDLLTQAGLRHRLTALGDGCLRLYDRQKDECVRWRPGRLGGLTGGDLWGLLRLLRAGTDRTVADCLASTPGWRRLWHPLALASLNTPPDQAMALAFANVLRASLLRGPAASRPLAPRQSWSADIVDPLLAYFRRSGGLWRPGCRLLRLQRRQGNIHLAFANQPEIHAQAVVLAVPAWEAARLLPGLPVPERHHPIVNLHIAYPGTRPPSMAGLLGGVAEWVFWRDETISVTISAADRLKDWRPERIHAAILDDLQWLLPRLGQTMPAPGAAWRLVREQRAGFAATFEQWHRRPACDAAGPGIFLAGDWVKNPYPATLEGATFLSGSYPDKIGMNALPPITSLPG